MDLRRLDRNTGRSMVSFTWEDNGAMGWLGEGDFDRRFTYVERIA